MIRHLHFHLLWALELFPIGIKLMVAGCMVVQKPLSNHFGIYSQLSYKFIINCNCRLCKTCAVLTNLDNVSAL